MIYEIASTSEFDKWLKSLKDRSTKNKVLTRLARVENGNFGDFKKLSDDLFELRFLFGAGIRIYYTLRNNLIVLLLFGGDKSGQQKDIEKAKRILNELEV